jgi:hypothetical protein
MGGEGGKRLAEGTGRAIGVSIEISVFDATGRCLVSEKLGCFCGKMLQLFLPAPYRSSSLQTPKALH